MKLELKHLAPYLPYDIRVEVKCDEEIYKSNLVGFGYFDKELHALCGNKINNGLYHINGEEYVKPILRPLSDLTKEINYGLSTYSFTDLFEIGDCYGCVFEFEHGNIKTIKSLESIAKYNSYNDINYLPNAVVNMMHEYHFDVFGLIEKGLAIDINTLS